MNLINKRINELIEAAGTHTSKHDRESHAQKLRNFIRAYGTSQRVSGVRDQKAIFATMNLVAVDAKKLDELEKQMHLLASYSGDALAATDVNWLEAGVADLRSDFMNPREQDDELSGPEFVIEDPDLDTLLNATATLLSGNANMDVGIAFSDALDKVLVRLKAPRAEEPRPEEPATSVVGLYQTRFRILAAIAACLGRMHVGLFKTGGAVLSDLISCSDGVSRQVLFFAFEEEFGIQFNDADRNKALAMNLDQLAAYIKEIPNKKEGGL